MSSQNSNPRSPDTGGVARRVILSIRSGVRANQTQEFSIEQAREIILGREQGAHVRFDPDGDDLVSRRHAKIVHEAQEGERFYLVDLQSSNGTFLNGHRMGWGERVLLQPGDLIQLGQGGPQLSFDLVPRPGAGLPATRLASSLPPPPRTSPVADVRAAVGGVGPVTVERMIVTATKRSRLHLQLFGLGVAFLAVLAAVFFFWTSRETSLKFSKLAEDRPLSPAEIAEKYHYSVVYVEAAWTLVHVGSGQELYHRYLNGLPTYFQIGDRIEPWLWAGDEGGTNQKIGGAISGTGFVIKEDGFILTNRHVANSWLSPYDGLPLPGLLCHYDLVDKDVRCDRGLDERDRPRLGRWIPGQAAFFGAHPEFVKTSEGRHSYFYVTFPGNTLRIPARVVRVSDVHDAALIRIDLPEPVRAVELNDNYETIRAGEAVTVLGYPAVSPMVGMLVASQDALDRSDKLRQIPEPSLSTGAIGRVIHGAERPAQGESIRYFSDAGDVYQLTINSAGAGNSGGPVFDDRGRVVGIFSYIRHSDVTLTFAVPIRYGGELMTIKPVVQ